MDFLQVTYRIEAEAEEAAAHAEAVLLEQTVETPAAVARRYPFVREHMMGSVKEIVPHPDGGVRATFTFPPLTAATDPAQFANVLFGNSSLHDYVVLEDFELPASLAQTFRGPQFGIAGLRARAGVRNRPLTCTALKPVGLPPEDLAGLCRTFAEGGIDVIKDDHYLADHPFCPFEERVQACLRAIDEAADKTGRRALYAPNLSGTPEEVRRQADFAQAAGVEVVMVAPMLLGLPFLYELTHGCLEVPVLAHPSFAGATRIRPDTLFGKLFRLYGADAVIFASYGGRFSYGRAVCRRIAERLRAPWGPCAPALPVPAGGMQVDRTAELVGFFGMDTMLLIGGSLLEAGDALLDRTRAFTERVARAALTGPNLE